jgi:hypothetical protein
LEELGNKKSGWIAEEGKNIFSRAEAQRRGEEDSFSPAKYRSIGI